jgi:eukaryotic-like serine/threonine-protein kinase
MSESLHSSTLEGQLPTTGANAAGARCLTEEEIMALLEPSSGLNVDLRVEAHLEACPDCRDIVLATCLNLDGVGTCFGSRQPFCLVFEPGSVVARRYCIRRLLGRGGMGEVYEAFDLASRKRVALKAVRATLCDQPAAIARLLSELRLGRRVNHPNVCRMLEVGQHRMSLDGGRVHFYTMQLIEGETLRKRLERGPLNLAQAIALGGEVLRGLRAIHDARIVHRDLKNDNLMLSGPASAPRVTIIDFGLARRRHENQDTGADGSSVGSGSLAYMAPEQAAGREVGPAADIFSFGVVLFEAITGRRPFEGPTPDRSCSRSRLSARAVLRLRDVSSSTPAWLVAFVDRCLQTNPVERFADAAEAAEHFEGSEQGLQTIVGD